MSKKALLSHCQDDVCGICLLRDPSCPDITILCCGSIYHMGCLLKWFHTQSKHHAHGSCPTCRHRIKLNTFSDEQSNPTLAATLQSLFQFPQSSSSQGIFRFHSESSDSSSGDGYSYDDDDDDDDMNDEDDHDGSSSRSSSSSESSDSTESTESFWNGERNQLHVPEEAVPWLSELLHESEDLSREYRMGLNISPSDQTGTTTAAPPLTTLPPLHVPADADVPTEDDTNSTPHFIPLLPNLIPCSTCHRLTDIRIRHTCSNRCCAVCCPTQPLFCPFHYQAFVETRQLGGANRDSWSDSRVSSSGEDSGADNDEDEDEEGSVESQSAMDFNFESPDGEPNPLTLSRPR
jgi:hypothetical protein